MLHERLTHERHLSLTQPESYFIRRIMCTPESVQMGSLSSPTSRANEASSNGLCIWPLPNGPRSPPRFAELQSLNCDATSSNFFSPDVIWCRYSSNSFNASSFDLVMFSCLHDDGRLDSRCLTRMWEHCTDDIFGGEPPGLSQRLSFVSGLK